MGSRLQARLFASRISASFAGQSDNSVPDRNRYTRCATRHRAPIGTARIRFEFSECELFHLGIERPNLSLDVEHVWGRDEKLAAIKRTLASWNATAAKPPSGIVYFTLIKTLVDYSQELHRSGIEHVCYHGDLERQERKRIQDKFIKGEIALVLATNAFGMGIDKEDIRFVVHADVPAAWKPIIKRLAVPVAMVSHRNACCCTINKIC